MGTRVFDPAHPQRTKTHMAFKSLITGLTPRGTRDLSRVRVLACLVLLLATLALTPSLATAAQDGVLRPAMLGNDIESLPLAPYALMQQDSAGKVNAKTIEDSNGTILSGKISGDDMVDFGYSGASYWLTTRIQNSATNEDWIVDLGRRSQGRLGYITEAQAYEMTLSTEGRVVVKEIPPLTDKGTFKFHIPTGTQKYILLRIVPAAGKPAVLPITLYNSKTFVAQAQSYFTPFVFHSLLLLGYAIFFLSSAFARNARSLYLFSAFFAFELLIWITTEELGAQIGFGMFDIMIPVMMLGYTLFSIFLLKSFLQVEQGGISERYILSCLAWLNVIASVLAFILPVSGGLTQICLLYGAPFFTFLILCLMAGAQSMGSNIAKRLYFIGTIFPVAAFPIIIGGLAGLVDHNAFLINSLWYSVAAQGFFMVLANHVKFTTLQGNVAAPNVEKGEVDFSRLRETRDTADHSRLLKVIEKERELLAEFRTKETERVNEMRKAKEEADEANRAKSAFLAVVSHEIRTPMTGVMGMVRMLLDSSITKQQRDYVLTIQESSEAMMALLNDILDFERIQRGKIELENISFDIHRLIQGVITLMSGHAAEKGIALSARMDDDIPKFVKGDPTRLRQVLLNLMGNAIKFTSEGSVTLLIRNMDDGEQKSSKRTETSTIYFAIQDSGIGISDDAKKNLFTPFAQANSTISRKFGGTGLGLAISKGLIENMGSTINISSKEGEGSTFFFTLDMERGLSNSTTEQQPPPGKDFSGKPAKSLRILVVDDNAISRKVVASFLEQDQHEILSASSAEEALEKINRDAFDLVFMDIELPGMTGNEATKKLRDHRDRAKAAIPVIAMTGNIAREDRERYLADGMSGFIGKPIEAEQLRAITNEIAHESFEHEIRMPQVNTPDPLSMSQEDFAAHAKKMEELAGDKDVFNPEMLQSLKDTIGAQQLGDLLTDLIVKTEEILLAMDDASKQKDLSSLAARAHELKGMAGNFGLVEISSLAAQAERKAKNSETDDLDQLIESFPDANLRAQNALKQWASH